MKLVKYLNNPILKPDLDHPWESKVVCNPAAWYENGRFYLLYRAAGNDSEHLIHLGLAESEDGFNFKRVSDKPVFSPDANGVDAGCVEDPRIIKIQDVFYITYAYRPYPPGQYWLRPTDAVSDYGVSPNAHVHFSKNTSNTGLAMSKDLRTFKRMGRITKACLDDRDVIIFPEKVNGNFVRLNRPLEWVGKVYGCEKPSIWISFSNDILEWGRCKLLAKPEFWWEEMKIGGSTPPIKTSEGWIHFYHGVDIKGTYRVGVMLLDLNDPSKILARPSDFIMEPEEDYERIGVYNGCVFPTGNVVVGDTVYVYYGSADEFCSVATCSLKELLGFLSSRRC